MALFSSIDLLLLLLVCNALIHFGRSLTLFDWTIQITNDSRNTSLATECWANGDSVGAKSIAPLARQAFLCHVLVKQTSRATCDMSLGNLRGRFDVFDSNRDSKRFRDRACLWVVNENGLFLSIASQLLLQYRWN